MRIIIIQEFLTDYIRRTRMPYARKFSPLVDMLGSWVRGLGPPVDQRFRPIILALSLSLLAHIAVLCLQRIGPFALDDHNSVTDLRLWIEQPSDREQYYPEVADVRQQSAPQSGNPEHVVTDSTGTADTADAATDASAVAALPTSEPVGDAASAASSPDTAAADAATAVAMTVASQSTEPAPDSDAVPVQTAVASAIPSAERSMVTRQILRWSSTVPDTGSPGKELAWQHQQQRYTAHVERQGANDSMGIERAIVEVHTEKDGVHYKSRVQLRRLAFSNFTQLVDQWDQNVQVHDDVIDGRFHSNSEIVVGWDRSVAPRFLGRVTTAAREYITGNTSSFRWNKDVFSSGIEFGAPRIVLPRNAMRLGGAQAERDVEVRSFAHDTRLVFHEDGSYSWGAARDPGAMTREQIPARPLQITAVKGASLLVQGVVRGRVLVYSPEGIVITGNLIYARDPHAGSDSADFLGLVSDRDVTVAPQSVTGHGNLRIEAAIFARDRFVIRDQLARDAAVLSIFGSLSAGSISASEPRFATRLEYDRRFEQLRPPGFPMANSYEVENWDGKWSRE